MRRAIAALAALVTAVVVLPAVLSPPASEAATLNHMTITGEISFWDEYECRPSVPNPDHCFDHSFKPPKRIKGFPVSIVAPASPQCGAATCPRPNGVFDWVFETAPGDFCRAYGSLLGLDFNCALAAAGTMDSSAPVIDGPWCGWASSQSVETGARVRTFGQWRTMDFNFRLTTNHVGPSFTWVLRNSFGAMVGTMVMTVTGGDGSCGLPPANTPTSRYEVAVDLTWHEMF